MNSSDHSFFSPKVRHLFNRLFNIRAWSDWDRAQSISNYFLGTLRRLFVPQPVKKANAKSFDDIVTELKLSDKAIKAKAMALKRLCIFMLCLAVSFYGYGMYQLLYGSILAVILSLVLMLISLSLAFRYHFWYFQIERRKLGCTLSEWFKETFMGENQ